MVEFGTVVGALTALFTMVTALGGLVVTVKVFIPNFKQTKKVHEIVNQQRTDMERYQTALVAALRAHGIDVPADQSKS